MEKCRVVVASRNPTKTRPVARAFQLMLCSPEIVEFEPIRRVEQPIGLEETVALAVDRARQAMNAIPGADYYVGVEAGAFMEKATGKPMELQVVAVLDKHGRLTIGFSQAFEIPSNWFKEMTEGKPLGAIAEEATRRKSIGRWEGIIGYLTRGVITRSMLTLHAAIMALTPRVNTKLYQLEGS